MGAGKKKQKIQANSIEFIIYFVCHSVSIIVSLHLTYVHRIIVYGIQKGDQKQSAHESTGELFITISIYVDATLYCLRCGTFSLLYTMKIVLSNSDVIFWQIYHIVLWLYYHVCKQFAFNFDWSLNDPHWRILSKYKYSFRLTFDINLLLWYRDINFPITVQFSAFYL